MYCFCCWLFNVFVCLEYFLVYYFFCPYYRCKQYYFPKYSKIHLRFFFFFTTRLFTKIQLKEIHKNHFSSVLKSNFSKNCYISELIHHETSTFFLKSVLKRTFSFFAASKILWTILLSLAPGLNCGHENSLLPKYEISGPDVHARHSLLFSENLSLILH